MIVVETVVLENVAFVQMHDARHSREPPAYVNTHYIKLRVGWQENDYVE